MGAPDVHEAFWVAIAAAAPVIGLAQVVTAEQTARRGERAAERAIREGRRPRPFSWFVYYTTFGNITLQAIALGAALYALANHRDHPYFRFLIGIAPVLGMVLIMLPGWLSSVATLGMTQRGDR